MFIDQNGQVFNDGAMLMNGQAHGPVGERLSGCRYEPGLMRPYFDSQGRPCVTVNVGYRQNTQTGDWEPHFKPVLITALQARGVNSPVFNATTLRKAEWIELDRAVIRATRQRLRAWGDLMNANVRGGFNGMSKITLEYEAMTDPGEAVVDMDAITDARTDRPLFKLRSLPLPITHSDFWFSAREIAVSRNSSTPLDTTLAEAGGRRVAEMVEKTTIGTETGVTFGTQTAGYGTHDGTSTVYGYTNFPFRVTKTNLATPTGANPDSVMADIISMRETMYANGFFGPFRVYNSIGYDQWMDNDYFRAGGTSVVRTLRERIASIEGIQSVSRLDFLTTNYQLVMVQMTPDVAQAVNGMDITTVQWESQGGMRLNFKIMCIQVPLLKAPYNGIAGIIHASNF